MTVKVLIVDDSGFFRRRLTDLINSSPDLQVVGTASNGQEAIEKAASLRPDVITMDYEMPVLDGISAVRQIMANCPTPILMFSSLTYEGARVTLDSLEAGAVDFLPKNFEEIAKSTAGLKKKLFGAIHAVANSVKTHRDGVRTPRSEAPADTGPSADTKSKSGPERQATPARCVGKGDSDRSSPSRHTGAVNNSRTKLKAQCDIVVIGTSTGGPVALQKVLSGLPANFSKPIFVVQHMPATFTPAFAERLNALCQIEVREAKEGDIAKPGLALLAPGGCQLMVGSRGTVRILPGDDRMTYKPSVDITFGSAANAFPGRVLAIVLTGMGADGRDGARLLKRSGSTVWAQDEATSVIYGMPMAVAKEGLADEVLPLQDFCHRLKELA
jgi:two-component system chemotaxis response regulator CheB